MWPLISYVTWGKLLNFLMPQFPCLNKNGCMLYTVIVRIKCINCIKHSLTYLWVSRRWLIEVRLSWAALLWAADCPRLGFSWPWDCSKDASKAQKQPQDVKALRQLVWPLWVFKCPRRQLCCTRKVCFRATYFWKLYLIYWNNKFRILLLPSSF